MAALERNVAESNRIGADNGGKLDRVLFLIFLSYMQMLITAQLLALLEPEEEQG